MCLSELGLVTKDDHKALALRVFAKYVSLTRTIQMRYRWVVLLVAFPSYAANLFFNSLYRLEPAGSQGVWGLDDYCFLPFYWGASQLLHHDTIKPSSIHVNQVLQTFGEEYMYLSSVQFVKQVSPARQTCFFTRLLFFWTELIPITTVTSTGQEGKPWRNITNAKRYKRRA